MVVRLEMKGIVTRDSPKTSGRASEFIPVKANQKNRILESTVTKSA